ncbi:hypothetical protein KEM54_001481 [Ascosphaera aggregata]|nr:hypothetical protein KEM54_001481 [Ascosphaera aggregata]
MADTRDPLLVSLNENGHVHLIIGATSLAASRCKRSLNVGASPIVIAPRDNQDKSILAQQADEGTIRWIPRSFLDEDLTQLGRKEVLGVVDAVFVTLPATHPSSTHISMLCRRLRISVNVADAPALCTFTLLATYSDGPVHVGVTTSGRGCKLASRLRREIAATLPDGLGHAVERLGELRKRIWQEEGKKDGVFSAVHFEVDDDDSVAQKSTFNHLVSAEDNQSSKVRRARWLSQICEYWPLRKLVNLSESDMDSILDSYRDSITDHSSEDSERRRYEHGDLKPGQIVLAGSGPGHPDLLTRAAYDAIQNADLILADKLVPEPVLSLIPRRTELFIARKFPGNADRAQKELLDIGMKALDQGRRVLRLKQGDPYLYGRGAEEVAFFREQGFNPIVLPGITSALSAPLFADIPATHRGATDQILICTGTGRKGVSPEPPTHVPTQTVVFLMALHRLPSLVESLISGAPSQLEGKECPTLERRLWPKETPCAVIERASCTDQRVIRSTLDQICTAVQEEGSRPPGLLVLGPSCGVLRSTDDKKWSVEEGFKGLNLLQNWREQLPGLFLTSKGGRRE